MEFLSVSRGITHAMRHLLPFTVFVSLIAVPSAVRSAAPASPTLDPPAPAVDVHDFLELTMRVPPGSCANPFTDAQFTGQVTPPGQPAVALEGFCDAADGSLFKLRYMPARPGRHAFTLRFQIGDSRQDFAGAFEARPSPRKGPVRVDPAHPWHFLWEGTGEHYFWNGTTTYWLLGWQDDAIIQQAIDRLARFKINRIRVALCGRTLSGERWDEPMVVSTEKFHFRLNPWVAQRPDSIENPGFDVRRFNVPFWQKCERMLRYARDKDMIVSVIYYLDGRDPGVDPFGKARMGSPEEKAYYQYGAARLAAFSNVMWDVSNEYHLFRNEPWVTRMAQHLRGLDPYRHLMSVHGHGKFPFRTEPWVDFALYQSWDEAGGHDFMLKNRKDQEATGRPMPQINEEYGYEDHYPKRWGGGRQAPARSADNRRRLAWGMVMAGGYQTTGERADRGTGKGPDTGGGWINGRGDDAMVMLEGYSHMVEALTRLDWWKLQPADSLVGGNAWCLAEPGRQYLIYLPAGGATTLRLPPGRFQATRFDPRTGAAQDLGAIAGDWTSPEFPNGQDGAWIIRVRSN